MDQVAIKLMKAEAETMRRQASSIGELAIKDVQAGNFQQAASHAAECQGYVEAARRLDALADYMTSVVNAFKTVSNALEDSHEKKPASVSQYQDICRVLSRFLRAYLGKDSSWSATYILEMLSKGDTDRALAIIEEWCVDECFDYIIPSIKEIKEKDYE